MSLLATPSDLTDISVELEEIGDLTALALTNDFLVVLFVCLGIIIGIMLADKFMR